MGELSVTELPLLPLRDVVVYPHMVLPLFVGRERSIEALENAMANDKQVLLVAQRNAADDDPRADDLYQVGTVSNILQLLKLPDGTIKVLVEGGFRASVDFVNDDGAFSTAGVREIEGVHSFYNHHALPLPADSSFRYRGRRPHQGRRQPRRKHYRKCQQGLPGLKILCAIPAAG